MAKRTFTRPPGMKLKPRGRPFQKGHPRAPGAGRKKGTKNHVTLEIKEFLLQLTKTPVYQRNVQGRILKGRAPTVELLALHWAGGKPKETHEVSAGTLDHLYALAAAKGLGSKEDPTLEKDELADKG